MAEINLIEYEKAVKALAEALSLIKNTTDIVMYKVLRDACIQRFEFCVELAWKLSKKKMGSNSPAPKTVVREMAQESLIDDPEKWLKYIDARNKTSHTYDEDLAKEVYSVVEMFINDGAELLRRLKLK